MAEVVIAGVGVGEQVPDDRQDRVADGDDRASFAAAAGDAVVSLAEEGAGAGGCGPARAARASLGRAGALAPGLRRRNAAPP